MLCLNDSKSCFGCSSVCSVLIRVSALTKLIIILLNYSKMGNANYNFIEFKVIIMGLCLTKMPGK